MQAAPLRLRVNNEPRRPARTVISFKRRTNHPSLVSSRAKASERHQFITKPFPSLLQTVLHLMI